MPDVGCDEQGNRIAAIRRFYFSVADEDLNLQSNGGGVMNKSAFS
jgi:hypothetical protein